MSEPFDPPIGDTIVAIDLSEPPPRSLWLWPATLGAIVCGITGLVYALQLVLFLRYAGYYGVAPCVVVGLAVPMLVFGLYIGREEPWAAFAAFVQAPLILVLSGGWFLMNCGWGVFSALGGCWTLTAIVPTIALPLLIPTLVRLRAYRRALEPE